MEDWAALLYEELRSLAHAQLRRERPDHTLGTTALVNEAWIRLASQEVLAASDRTHFLAIASTTMRRVLVDHARQRQRQKRGGGAAHVPLDDVAWFLSKEEADEIVALDDALVRLQQLNERAAQVVQHRFFAGYTLEETAALLDVSLKTVQRDWLVASAWLRKEVAQDLGMFDAPT